MNSTWGTTHAWALRTTFLALLFSLPIISGVVYDWMQLQIRTTTYEVTKQKLHEHQRAAAIINEKLRKKKKATDSASSLTMLYPIGAVLTADVSLLTVNTSFDKQETRLEIAAQSLPALLEYVKRLQHVPVQAELQSHRLEKDQASRWPIQATVIIRSFPEANNENKL